MAAMTFANMAYPTHFNQQNQCIDPNDMDSFVDFGSMPSPGESSKSKAPMSRSESTMTSPTNTVVPLDYEEAPVEPLHDYQRYKQTTGLPFGSFPNLLTGIPEDGPSNDFSNTGFNTGLGGEFGEGSSSMFMGSNSGLGIDTDMGLDPAFFYPGASQSDDFVDPSAITAQEEQPKVRYYPGMHQQQAALAKAQQQAQQQRQQQQQQKQQQQPEQSRAGSSRKSVTPIDARTEETIARVVNQIRQNSSFASDAGSPTGNMLSKMKKDEEDMDEDERLLNSEEGKKLSSKERRQLRNKVSARAFRSRRKEYIGQLEGDIAQRANEVTDLKNANRALMEENARFRELTVKLLRHPAFTPFLDDISRDPALSDSLSKVSASMTNTSAVTESKPQVVEAPQQQDLQIGMATIPEPQLDFSALNLNGNNWAMPNGFGYQPQIFAVTELPEGPVEPLEVNSKGEESIIERFAPVEETKSDYPEFAAPATESAKAPVEPVEIDESDPTMTLYANVSKSSAPAPTTESQSFEPIFGNIAPEKALARVEITVTDGSDAAALEAHLSVLCARADSSFQRLQAMSAQFE